MQKHVPELQMARIMDPWTTQGGYPYLTVNVTGTNVSIKQRRFLLKFKNHADTTTWPIPLTFATKESEFDNTSPQDIYYKEDGDEKTITLTAAPDSYFIMNNQQTGFYRVNYDIDNWMKIKAALNSANYGGIHVLNRAQIVDDLFNFARAAIVDYGTALEILEYIRTETHYVPWLAFFNGLTYLTRRVASAGDAELFEYHLMNLLEPIYQNIGFYPREGDTQTQIYTRNSVLSWLCRYGHEDCLTNARNEFRKFVDAPTTYL
jgi:aminopeptidase N